MMQANGSSKNTHILTVSASKVVSSAKRTNKREQMRRSKVKMSRMTTSMLEAFTMVRFERKLL